MFKMKPIPPDCRNRGWKVFVDGVELQNPGLVQIVSPRFGELTYGLRPEGYDSWTYTNPDNVVTVLYSIGKGEYSGLVLVGFVRENRPNMGGEVLCVVGGFTDPGETLVQAQARERSEESGLTGQAVPVGDTIVADRLFWDSSEPGKGGVQTFVQKVPFGDLVQADAGVWKLKEGSSHLMDFKKGGLLEFRPWGEMVTQTRDGIGLAALIRFLQAHQVGDIG